MDNEETNPNSEVASEGAEDTSTPVIEEAASADQTEASASATEETASEDETVQVLTTPEKVEIVDDPRMKWYVVGAQAGQEKKAAATLRERIKYSAYAEQFGTVLVPSEEVVELRAGKRRRSERRFYPGYIFVQMEMDDSTWELVRKTSRITGFIGGTIAKPTPLPQSEIQLILDRIDQGGEKVTPKTVFEPGELIRVIDGPFNEFSGTVEEVNYKKQQLVVAVTIFGRSTPVELDFSQVEKG